jgi:hypothetical protein
MTVTMHKLELGHPPGVSSRESLVHSYCKLRVATDSPWAPVMIHCIRQQLIIPSAFCRHTETSTFCNRHMCKNANNSHGIFSEMRHEWKLSKVRCCTEQWFRDTIKHFLVSSYNRTIPICKDLLIFASWKVPKPLLLC